MIYSDGSWRIYWRWGGKRYAAAAGYSDPADKDKVELLRREVASALGKTVPEFPPAIADSAAVRRYLATRYGVPADEAPAAAPVSSQALLDEYGRELKTAVSKLWAANSISHLKRLQKSVGGLDHVDEKAAAKFLADMIDVSELGPASRNRALAAFLRFYKWAVATRRLGQNPFSHCKMIREPPPEYITYCSKGEMDRVLAAATATGRADWIAVAIAFYAGCRREEVFRLRWEDVFFDSQRIIIRKSKTNRQRAIPLAKELIAILEPIRKERGQVVPAVKDDASPRQDTWQNRSDRLVELLREQLCRPENPDDKGNPEEVIGKRRFLMTEASLHNLPATLATMARSVARMKDSAKKEKAVALLERLRKCPKTAHDKGEWIPAERIGWTAFRHTFASLRAQKGVGLDKISSWMGNTLEVCRRHYAQFVPRDGKDDDIDKY